METTVYFMPQDVHDVGCPYVQDFSPSALALDIRCALRSIFFSTVPGMGVSQHLQHGTLNPRPSPDSRTVPGG